MLNVFKLTGLFFFVSAFAVFAQEPEKEFTQGNKEFQTEQMNAIADIRIVREYFNSFNINEKGAYSPDELITLAAIFLLNKPYLSGTLDINKGEELVVNLREFDCMTFVENCLALSRTVQYPNYDYDYFVRELKKIRYRNGLIQGYTSRLHYTTEWISDNVAKGEIEDITHALGGKKFKPDIYYMSSHPNLYSGLKDNSENIEAMVEIETHINQRSNYYFIPRNEINEKSALIKNGDIICFTTSLPGLDVSHVGIACWDKGQLSFIHASTKAGKVIVNPESLSDYCNMIKTNTGIIVLRPAPVVNDVTL